MESRRARSACEIGVAEIDGALHDHQEGGYEESFPFFVGIVRFYLWGLLRLAMMSNDDFPDIRGDVAKVLEWLQGYADWVAAFYPSDVRDHERAFRHVLLIALHHESSEIRCEALNVLQRSLEKHETAHIFARPIAENLVRFQGEELLVALNIIGLSYDVSLAGHLVPFLSDQDPQVRSEAYEASAELESLGRHDQP